MSFIVLYLLPPTSGIIFSESSVKTDWNWLFSAFALSCNCIVWCFALTFKWRYDSCFFPCGLKKRKEFLWVWFVVWSYDVWYIVPIWFSVTAR
jgi:hypothetical protein